MASAQDSLFANKLNRIIDCLDRQIDYNITNQKRNKKKSHFNAKLKYDISLRSYIINLYGSTGMEITTLQYALILLEKYCTKTSTYLLQENCFKLILICILISRKLNEDYELSDRFLAFCGGIKLKRMIELEAEFLETLDYKIYNL